LGAILAVIIFYASRPASSYLTEANSLELEIGMVAREVQVEVSNIATSKGNLSQLEKSLNLNMTKNKYLTAFRVSPQGSIVINGSAPSNLVVKDSKETAPQNVELELTPVVGSSGLIEWKCSGSPLMFVKNICTRLVHKSLTS